MGPSAGMSIIEEIYIARTIFTFLDNYVRDVGHRWHRKYQLIYTRVMTRAARYRDAQRPLFTERGEWEQHPDRNLFTKHSTWSNPVRGFHFSPLPLLRSSRSRSFSHSPSRLFFPLSIVSMQLCSSASVVALQFISKFAFCWPFFQFLLLKSIA